MGKRTVARPMQSFWLRLWIGFLIGVTLVFIGLAILGVARDQPIISVLDATLFIASSVANVIFLFEILRWRKYGVYGTILMTIVANIFYIKWDAGILWSFIFSIVPLIVTVSLASKHWGEYL